MKIILYDSSEDGKGNKHLQKTIESTISDNPLEVFHRIPDLIRRFHRIPKEVDIAVLLAQSDEQLSELVVLKNIIEDVPIILALPKQDRAMIKKGYHLNPKFIDFMDGGFSNTSAVLEKMMNRINN